MVAGKHHQDDDLSGSSPATFPGDAPEAREWRERMVWEQIHARGIRDQRVLNAFLRVPRHLFCPPDTPLHQAYADHPLPIGRGQTISQPYMVAEMTAWLDPDEDDRILEIGAGSGYQAAILACLAREVHSVERIPELAAEAEERLKRLGFHNVHIHVGDGTEGWPPAAPYDGIIVTAAAPETPEPLLRQLADGGRLVIPVGSRYLQDLCIWQRHGEKFEVHRAGGCRFVPLIGRYGWPH